MTKANRMTKANLLLPFAWRGKISIAVLAATAALAGGSLALSPPPASAMTAEESPTECSGTDFNWFDQLEECEQGGGSGGDGGSGDDGTDGGGSGDEDSDDPEGEQAECQYYGGGCEGPGDSSGGDSGDDPWPSEDPGTSDDPGPSDDPGGPSGDTGGGGSGPVEPPPPPPDPCLDEFNAWVDAFDHTKQIVAEKGDDDPETKAVIEREERAVRALRACRGGGPIIITRPAPIGDRPDLAGDSPLATRDRMISARGGADREKSDGLRRDQTSAQAGKGHRKRSAKRHPGKAKSRR
jgi:hypothetical protein